MTTNITARPIPAEHEVVAPEAFVIRHKQSGQFATDAWFHQDKFQWQVEFSHLIDEAMSFPTRELALGWARSWHAGKECQLVRIAAQVRLSDSARSDVLARRAGRNADRKF